MGVTPRRVFISHTSEFATFPPSRTFVDAARDAVLRAGDVPIDMSQFGASTEAPAAYSERQVENADVYVGIIGFRYGSPVVDSPEISYTELEYLAASGRNIPTLLFILSEHALVPVGMFSDVITHERQSRFRETLLNSDRTCVSFDNPADLGSSIYQALIELRSSMPAGRAQPKTRPIWMLPPVTARLIPRPVQTREIVRLLSESESSRIGITTALRGAGGFGKTTLAIAACLQSEVSARFPDGVLWVTVGENVSTERLAEKINDLSEVVSGSRPTLSDPDVAGFRLGELIGNRRFLLVVDDVWTRSQLRPFLHGAESCSRLITTRVGSVLPEDSVSVVVGAMTDDEANALLSRGVDDLPMHSASRLLARTGRWPVLLALINKSLQRQVAAGESASLAGERIDERLRSRGPAALDVRRAKDRADAVAATMGASLEGLPNDDLTRFLQLAIFPEDEDIPVSVLATFWRANESRSALDAELLCEDLIDLSLVLPASSGSGVRLHDVVRSYLRSRMGAHDLVNLNQRLLDALIQNTTTDSEPGPLRPWWRLPADEIYTWRHLGYHLREAEKAEEFEELCRSLTYLTAKLRVLGPVEVEADLALATTPQARDLQWALGRSAHLMAHTVPDHALTSIFLSRLEQSEDLKSLVTPFEAQLGFPMLRPKWPLPDMPHPALKRTLVGHSSGVWACASGMAGRWLASTGGDGVVRIWDVRTGQALRVFSERAGMNWACPLDPLGRWVASAGDDGTIVIRRLTGKGEVIRSLRGHAGPVRACAISPRGAWLASGGSDRTIRVWDVATGNQRLQLSGHAGWIRACVAGPDGTWIAAGGDDGTVRVWHAGDGSVLKTLEGHAGPVRALAVAPHGCWLASGGADGSVRVWDAETGEQRSLLNGHSGWIRSCVAGPAGNWLATAGDDRTVRIWTVNDDEISLRAELLGHQGAVWAGAAGDDAGREWLATAGVDGKILLWDAAKFDQPPAEPDGTNGAVKTCGVSGPGHWIIGAGEDHRVRLWDLDTGHYLGVLPTERKTVRSCVVSPDSRLVVTGGDDQLVQVWDAERRVLVSTLAGHSAPVRCCAFSPDMSQIVSGGDDHTVKIWETHTGRLLKTLEGHKGAVRTCAYDPRGAWIASAGGDRVIRLWSPENGQELAVLRGHDGYVRAVAADPRGGSLASVGDDRLVRIWNIESGAEATVLTGHRGAIWACAYDSSGSTLATGGDDPDVFLWDTSRGQGIGRMGKHTLGIRAMAAGRNGQLVTSANDESIRVWDIPERRLRSVIETDVSWWRSCTVSHEPRLIVASSSAGAVRVLSEQGETLRVISAHEGAVTSVLIDPSGSWIISTGEDGRIRQWDVESGLTLADLDKGSDRNVLGSALSADSRLLATASSDGVVTIWDLVGGSTVRAERCHEGWVRGCAFSPDSRFVVSAGYDGLIAYTDIKSGEVVRYPGGHDGWVMACAVAKTTGRIATAGSDGTVRLWRAYGAEPERTLAGHASTVRACAFDFTGDLLASVDEHGEIKIWAIVDGSCVTMLRVTHALRDCAWFPRERMLCAVGGGGIFSFDLVNYESQAGADR